MSQETEWLNWPIYYRAVRNRPPRDTLVKALELFDVEKPPDSPRFAIDLGCGTGSDTIALLQQGWRVLAIDGQATAIELLREDAPSAAHALLETRVATFEELADEALPAADLVNASLSLPFCGPQTFAALWQKIVASLRPGGCFAGQLFGPNDGWVGKPSMTFHSRREAEALLKPFDIAQFHELDADGALVTGEKKHWHIFSIVARKRNER